MRRVSKIRARRRTAAQQMALVQVKREISATDPHGRLKYLREFTEAHTSYQKQVSMAELEQEYRNSDILLIGDYHALPSSQAFAAGVLEALIHDSRPVVLAVEMAFQEDQSKLDRWFRGEISDEALRLQMRFDLNWGYDWKPYIELLRKARRHKVKLHGVDCQLRGNTRRIVARDKQVAASIAAIRVDHPEACLLVVFGEAHLAPNHLPHWVKSLRPFDRVVTVLQNIEELYWKSIGAAGETAPVQMGKDQFCVFNATPLEKYESYRVYIERWGTESLQPDFAPTFYNLADTLLRSLGLEDYSPAAGTHPRTRLDGYPEVVASGEIKECRALLESKTQSNSRRKRLRVLRRRGCIYLAEHNVLLIQRFQMSAVAEEAVHFVQRACRGAASLRGPWAGLSQDHSFYFNVVDRALTAFGSRILLLDYQHGRPPEANYEGMQGFKAIGLMEIVGEHCNSIPIDKNGEKCKRPETRQRPVKGRDFLVEKLGSLLGADLYEAYLRDELSQSYLRSLFFRKIHLPGVAKKLFVELVALSKLYDSSRVDLPS